MDQRGWTELGQITNATPASQPYVQLDSGSVPQPASCVAGYTPAVGDRVVVHVSAGGDRVVLDRIR